MRKEQFIIFLLVGVMLFSALGTGLLLILDNGSEGKTLGQDITKLEIEDTKAGNGAVAEAGDTITVNYEGKLLDGTVFDSSYERGQPATFALEGLIQGWQEGIPGMKEGGERQLKIPSEKGYGPAGSGTIPPNSDLIFKIELIKVEKKNS